MRRAVLRFWTLIVVLCLGFKLFLYVLLYFPSIGFLQTDFSVVFNLSRSFLCIQAKCSLYSRDFSACVFLTHPDIQVCIFFFFPFFGNYLPRDFFICVLLENAEKNIIKQINWAATRITAFFPSRLPLPRENIPD